MNPNHIHKATVLSVHDGDTFTCLVKLDFFVRAQVNVRLHGYSAPELNEDQGTEAREMLMGRIPPGIEVVISSVFAETATPTQQEGTQSFTRWVCDVEVLESSVNEWMRENAPHGGIGT